MKGKKSRMPGKTTPPDTAEATKETTTANNASATNRQLGGKVPFLTKWGYKSTGSFVNRLSRSKIYFVAIVDEFGNVIQQNLYNIRVVGYN